MPPPMLDLEFLTGLPSLQEVARYQYKLYSQFDPEAVTWDELTPEKQLALELSLRAMQANVNNQPQSIEYWKELAKRRLDRKNRLV